MLTRNLSEERCSQIRALLNIINSANRNQKRPQTTSAYYSTINDYLSSTEMTADEKKQRAEWEWELSSKSEDKEKWIQNKMKNLQNHRRLEDLFMTTRFRRFTKNLMVGILLKSTEV